MLWFLLISLWLLPAGLAAAAPTTQSIASAYAELNDADFQTRQAARQSLLTLSADQLPLLRQAVAAHPPKPAQIPILHQVVTEAVMKSDDYASDPDHGFLGIRLDEISLNDGDHRVFVQSCMEGFVAYRRLRDGDVILAVQDGRRWTEIDGMVELQQAISRKPAGKHLQLLILRGGQVLKVSVTLDALPLALGQSGPATLMQFNELQTSRLKAAQSYWDQHFAPLCATP